jgi:hypothetical protein
MQQQQRQKAAAAAAGPAALFVPHLLFLTLLWSAVASAVFQKFLMAVFVRPDSSLLMDDH